MLNLDRLYRSYNHRTRSYAELLPWFREATPGLILNLDGSLMAAFEYQGEDIESTNEGDVTGSVDSMRMAMRAFDDHNTIWTYYDKRRCTYTEQAEFENEVAGYIDRTWRENVDNGRLGTARHVVVVSYQPFSGANGFFDEVSARVVRRDENVVKAFVKVASKRLARRSNLERIEGPLISSIIEFEKQLATFRDTLSARLKIKRLINDELRTELSNRANLASPRPTVLTPEGVYYLNTLLPTDTVRREAGGYLRFDSPMATKYVSVHSVKGYPGFAKTLVVESLMSVQGDFTVVNLFRMLDREAAKQHIQDQEAHYRGNVKSQLIQAVEKFGGFVSERVDGGMVELAKDAQAALVEVTKDEVDFGYHTMVFVVIGSTKEENDATTQQLAGIFTNAGYGLVKEEVNLLGAFAAAIPGAADAVVRTALVSSSNLSNLAVLRSQSTGEDVNRYLTEQRRAHSPSLAVLPTATDLPELFNLHVGDVGHFMVIGSTGGGKTTLINFFIHCWQKYSPCRTIVISRDYANYITIKSLGGNYIDLTERGGGAKMNPARWLANPKDHPKLRRWLELAMRAIDTTPLSAEDAMKIDKAIAIAARQAGSHTLSKIHAILSGQDRDLGARLHAWTRHSDRYGEHFDNEEDAFEIGTITGIEVGGLLKDEHLAPALLAYLFEVVEEAVGQFLCPTFIYLEEAWYLLRNSAFRDIFEEWIRTMRARMAVVGIATHSVSDLKDCPIGQALNDNIKTRIFLPNRNAQDSFDTYINSCGLQPQQIEIIKSAKPKQDYYIVQEARHRLVKPEFPPEIVALTRSDVLARRTFDAECARGGDWLARYMEEMTNVA